MRMKRIAVAGLLVLSGCGGGSNNGSSAAGSSPASSLDPDVPPVTSGTWYRPPVTATWQWQLTGTVNTGYAVDVYDIDLFESPASLIRDLQAMGVRVICYFSAGSRESYRPDSGDFEASDLGKPLDGFEDERWLDIRSENVRLIMLDRLDLAARKGCDGVEPDNVDGYANDSGFPLNARDQRAYNRHIANEAHRRGLSVGLKNDLDQIPELVDYYDFSVNEQCHQYDECKLLEPFITGGKPVFNAEYARRYVNDPDQRRRLCDDARTRGLHTLVLPLDLDDSFRFTCDS